MKRCLTSIGLSMVVVCILVLLIPSIPAIAQEGVSAAGGSESAAGRPNIVLMIGDDQAWGDYGFMGSQTIKTPSLDRLARRSLVFRRGYLASPICRPSLASIVTGLFPSTHGVTGNDVVQGKQRVREDIKLREQFHRYPSLVRSLSNAGYLTFQSGKWWEGSFDDGGFTHGMTHGDPARGGRHGDAGLAIGRRGLQPISDFIDVAKREAKPFFVWYAPFLPHTPHNPPAELLEKYAMDGRPADEARYYAMCEWHDRECGKLLKMLADKHVAENTVVAFLCDNGWKTVSSNVGNPNQGSWKSYGMRSKGSPYENGIRTPILISWPGHVEPADSDAFAHSVDLFPTLAKLAGVESPEDLPGVDLLDKTARRSRTQVFGVNHSTHNMTIGDTDATLQYLYCVEDEWKLIVRYDGVDTSRYKALHEWDTAPVHLYRIQEDPEELKDVSEKHPEVVKRMTAAIESWHARQISATRK